MFMFPIGDSYRQRQQDKGWLANFYFSDFIHKYAADTNTGGGGGGPSQGPTTAQ